MSSYFVEYYKTLFVVQLFPLQTYTILTDDAFLFSTKCDVVKGPIIYFIEGKIMSRLFGGFVFGIYALMENFLEKEEKISIFYSSQIVLLIY